jgi:hypothetical protein
VIIGIISEIHLQVYSRKGIQLGSKEISNKSPHSGRNAPIVEPAGDRNQKIMGKLLQE